MKNEAPAAIIASTGKASTMADGTLRIVVEIEPRHAKDAFSLFGTHGTPVALARITQEASKGEMQKSVIEHSEEKGQYGKSYELLYKHGFFYALPLHEVLGIADEILHLRAQNASPHEITDRVKSELHTHFKTNSLTKIQPDYFRAWLRENGIEHLLPKDFV